MSKKFQYQGRLRETALPEVLYSIQRFRVPGVLEATSGKLVKRVFLRDGYVIHAASNDLGDSLGEFLERREMLDAATHERISRQRAKSKRRVGELLIEHGVMTPQEVLDAIRMQIEDIVWSLFYWDDGEVTFSLGDFQADDRIQIQLPVPRVILEGIRRAPEAKPLVERVGRRETILEASYETESLIELGLDRAEYELLTSVDGEATFYELCSNGPLSAADNAKLLYAFQVLHLVRRPASGEAVEASAEGRSSGPVKIQL